LCADVVFYAASCFVSAVSIGLKGWLLGRKLRSRHSTGNRVGAAPHFALARVRRPSLRKSISIAPGAIVLEEKFEKVTMKKAKYLMYLAQVWPAMLIVSFFSVARRPTALCPGVF
jgi:hypothetical protein